LGAWREARDLTLEQVAEMFDLSFASIQRWENGIHPVTFTNMLKLAEIYGAATVTELTFAPSHRHLAKDAERALALLSVMEDDHRKQWLALGAALATKKSG
jgi:transcriptional regulator with XRE-family HTH domain